MDLFFKWVIKIQNEMLIKIERKILNHEYVYKDKFKMSIRRKNRAFIDSFLNSISHLYNFCERHKIGYYFTLK